jgi:hypothetical protein
VTAPPRVTGIGGVFFKARNPARLGDWYRTHLGIDVQEGGWALRREGVAVEGSRIELWQPPPDR